MDNNQKVFNHYYKILLPIALNEGLTYGSDELLPLGSFVKIPLGKKHALGVVWNLTDKKEALSSNFTIKPITELYQFPALSDNLRQFITQTANYTINPLGNVLKLSLPQNKIIEDFLHNKLPVFDDNLTEHIIKLSEAQNEVLNKLMVKFVQNSFHVSLLYGVTGSGKTEVFFGLIAKLLAKNNGQILIMLPEVMLADQILQRFEERFGFHALRWHSSLTLKQRRENYYAIATGKAKVIIGARSALFLPFKNLRFIVVDEEHDGSFKQEDGVTYHARDMAVLRGKLEDIPVLLASATPSIETINNVINGRYDQATLPSRYGVAQMPDIKIIDMRNSKIGSNSWIGKELADALQHNLSSGKQSLLFINRRGYAPLSLCRICGFHYQCPNCSSWLVMHMKKNALICHHCNHHQALPKNCFNCDTPDSVVQCGPGVERLAEEAQKLMPDAKLCVLTSDNTKSPKAASDIIEQISQGEVDVIIGTQIIAKGHNFPKLTLVGIVDADLGLTGGDLRASERSFQLLQQVAGRAGRMEDKGTVYIQSYLPDNLVIKALSNNDWNSFIKFELTSRKNIFMPPFSRLCAIIISGVKEERVKTIGQIIAKKASLYKDFYVLGPAPAPINYIRKKYRYRLLFKANRNVNLQGAIRNILSNITLHGADRIKVDVDPYSFL